MPMLRLHAVCFPCVLMAAAVLAVPASGAEELLPPDRPMGQVIDHYVEKQLQDKGIDPAPQVDDARLIRRLTLDLVGRIPTPLEVRTYVDSQDPKKREKLIDRLMEGEGFIRHHVTELNAMLMPADKGDLKEYLTRAVTENRSWDQVFRELIAGDEDDDKLKGASSFLRERVGDTDRLTADVSSLFFGVNVSCAQCHDHPLVYDWKQAHYYGMKSFFDRTFDNGGHLAERSAGLVKYKTTYGETKEAKLMFLTGKVIEHPSVKEPSKEEKREEDKRFQEFKKQKKPAPSPKWSARRQLIDVALAPDQRQFFARSIVNRMWHRYYGHGLVMPLDQMHSENLPSHETLLQWLARDTIENGYHLRRLIRGLLLSETYSRDSHWSGSDRPEPESFAVAKVRPLTPEQLGASLKVATADPSDFTEEKKPEDRQERLNDLARSGDRYSRVFERPDEHFQVSVGEALWFSNNDQARRDFLNGGLVPHLVKLEDHPQAVEAAVWNILCRAPNEEEAGAMLDYVSARKDRPDAAYRQVVWALLTSSEFRFNH